MIETSLERMLRLARPYQRQERGRLQRVRGYAGRQAGRAMGALERAHLPEDVSLPTLVPHEQPKAPEWNPSADFKQSLGRIHPLGDKVDDQLAADRRSAQGQSPEQPVHRDWISPVKWAEGQQIWKQRGEAATVAADQAVVKADDSRWKAARAAVQGGDSRGAHDDALRLLARQVAFHNVEAARAIDRAADAYGAGRHQASIGHLDNAVFLLRAAGHHTDAAKIKKVRDAIPWSGPEQAMAYDRAVTGLGPSKGMSKLQAFEAEANMPQEPWAGGLPRTQHGAGLVSQDQNKATWGRLNMRQRGR